MERGDFPGVAKFALTRKLALVAAHDSILSARVKQTRNGNRKRRYCPFSEGDLVYVSTANITFPKGLARKLIPKYMGPYAITKAFGNDSFQIDMPREWVKRGVHNGFHAEKLRAHIANDDRLFPGRSMEQIRGLNDSSEWAVDEIVAHVGQKADSIFQMKWKSGDLTWMPYRDVVRLDALQAYLELLGVEGITGLPEGNGVLPAAAEVFVGSIEIPGRRRTLNTRRLRGGDKLSLPSRSFIPPFPITNRRYFNKPRIAVRSHIFMSDFRHAFIKRKGRNTFRLQDPDAEDMDRFEIHPAQVRSYVHYEDELRSGHRPTWQPAGYALWARVYNLDSTDNDKFAEVDAQSLAIEGPDSIAPDRSYLHVGEEDYGAPRAAPLQEGAKILSKEEADANFFALTEFAARAKYRKDKALKGFSARDEKRADGEGESSSRGVSKKRRGDAGEPRVAKVAKVAKVCTATAGVKSKVVPAAKEIADEDMELEDADAEGELELDDAVAAG